MFLYLLILEVRKSKIIKIKCENRIKWIKSESEYVHSKMSNELEQAGTTRNELELPGTSWNHLKRDELSNKLTHT